MSLSGLVWTLIQPELIYPIGGRRVIRLTTIARKLSTLRKFFLAKKEE